MISEAEEYARLDTPAQWRERFPEGRVPFRSALEVVGQLAHILHQAHLEIISDRDVTPVSVRIEGGTDGPVRARLLELQEKGDASEEEVPAVLDSWRYRAPERWWGHGLSSASDQYALAALFVELVTGTAPFSEVLATNDATVAKTVVTNSPARLPEDCPSRAVLMRALEKNPRKRFATCSEFVAALADPDHAPERRSHHQAHEHQPMPQTHHSHRHTGGARPGERRPKRRLGFVKFILVVGGLVGGGVWAVRSGFAARMLETAGERERNVRALQRNPQQSAEEAQRLQEVRLQSVEAELVRQKAAADRALKDLQVFLETGDPAMLAVRRDALVLDVKRVRQNLATLEGELATTRKLVNALTELRLGAGMFESVSSLISKESALHQAHANFVADALKLQQLIKQFKEKHPDVREQRKVFAESRRIYVSAVDAALTQAQNTVTAKAAQEEALTSEVLRLETELAAVGRDFQIAQQKQDELTRASERESQLLVDLRLREHELRFGATAGGSATNGQQNAAH